MPCQGQLSSRVLAWAGASQPERGMGPPEPGGEGKTPKGGTGKGLERDPFLLNQLSAYEIIIPPLGRALPCPPPTVRKVPGRAGGHYTGIWGDFHTFTKLPAAWSLLTREIKGIRSLSMMRQGSEGL